jgi:hypothetical protein
MRSLISKIIRAKWMGDVAQVIECLLRKSEVMSSKPNPTANKQKTAGFYPCEHRWKGGSHTIIWGRDSGDLTEGMGKEFWMYLDSRANRMS